MNKKNRIVFIISTALLSLLMLFSAGMYFFNYPMVSETFAGLGFPTYIIYPLAIAKILGVAALWFSKHDVIRHAAYAGFVFVGLLASSAHLAIADGGAAPAFVAALLAVTSYFFGQKTKELAI